MAALFAVTVAGCSYDQYAVIPALSPLVLPKRGSVLVTILTSDQRLTIHHKPESFWSPANDSVVHSERVNKSYRDLDVRTCKSSSRWFAPSGSEPDGSDVPMAERAMIGPVRFYTSVTMTDLMAANAGTGHTWTAVTGSVPIASVTAVPAARRVVLLTADPVRRQK